MEISFTMDVYIITFIFLLGGSGYMAYTQHRQDLHYFHQSKEARLEAADAQNSGTNFLKRFIPVYLLVMASDWLQGAYVYTLYKDEKQLEESVVAALFTSGFLSAAISALFVGSLADKHGRRLACLVFCGAYAVGCLTKISNDVTILFIGRLLGGFCTTLLFSTFESWMVTEYFSLQLEKSSMSLSIVFGLMTMLNGLVAIASGVVGESLVKATGTKVSPFLGAIICLGGAFYWMIKYWGENYGDRSALTSNLPTQSTFNHILKDRNILLLTFISCCFEGSMYIMVFFWSAAMTRAHALTFPESPSSRVKQPLSGSVSKVTPDIPKDPDIPFGLIFASFMAAMMIGSLTFSRASSPNSRLSQMFSPVSLLTLSIAGAAVSILMVVLFKNESISFWCFCIFEACIGVYYPSMGIQKSKAVDDSMRANVYGIMRIPLNIFVVLALTTTVEGDQHRDRVFVICGALLLAAAVAAGMFLEVETSSSTHTPIHSDVDIDDD